MAKTAETVDVAEVLGTDDVSLEAVARLRADVHAGTEVRSEMEKLLENFGPVSRKLSSDNLVGTRKATATWVLGKVEEALGLYESCRSSKEKNFFAGLSCLDLDRIHDALKYLKEAYEAEPSNLLIQLYYAEAKAKVGLVDESVNLLDRLPKKYEEHPDPWYVRGLCHDILGEYDKAQESYEHALKLEPTHPRAMFRLAYNLDINGEDDEALKLYEQLRKLRPVHVNTLINLGIMYEDKGEYERASDCYSSVLDYYPNHRRARKYLSDAQASLHMFYDEELTQREGKLAQVLAVPIMNLNLSQRVRQALEKIGARVLGDVVRKTEEELMEIPNFGKTSIAELKEVLRLKGLTLPANREAAMAMSESAARAGDDALNKPLSDFEWSGRIRKVFEKYGMVTVGDLLQKTEKELLKNRNLGMTSVKEIRQKLATVGLSLQAG